MLPEREQEADVTPSGDGCSATSSHWVILPTLPVHDGDDQLADRRLWLWLCLWSRQEVFYLLCATTAGFRTKRPLCAVSREDGRAEGSAPSHRTNIVWRHCVRVHLSPQRSCWWTLAVVTSRQPANVI